MAQEKVPAVYAAINAVTDELRKVGIGKNKGTNTSSGYGFRYRGIDDVYNALSPALSAHNLVIAPVAFDTVSDLTTGGQKPQRIVRICVTYACVSTLDGSRFEVKTIGEGMDTSDKATGKAMSYAYKNLIFQLFCIPVDGQPDTDSEVIEPVGAFVPEDLLIAAEDAANEGFEAYKAFWANTSKQGREALQRSGQHDRLKALAKGSDEESK